MTWARQLGDTAVLVEGSFLPAGYPPGVLDIVPAFGVTAVHFDPVVTDAQVIADWIDGSLEDVGDAFAGRDLEIPVLYDGPDLSEVGQGWGADEVVRRHAGAEFRVGAVGFQPGFGYLEGLPEALHTPRRSTPRTRVPAGSVAIGGAYTGVYPSDSPGGWNLIGRTPLQMWDEHRAEPSFLGVGDRVHFRPIDAAEFQQLAAESQAAPAPDRKPLEHPALRIVHPGVQTTALDLGSPGRQHLGITPGGAMDTASLRLANLMIGNAQDVPAIEATLVGPVFEALQPIAIGLAGAVQVAAPRQVACGEQIDLRQLTGGARAYLALPGGVEGRLGQPLEEGEIVGARSVVSPQFANEGWSLPNAAWIRGADPIVLRVLRGPQGDRFDGDDWRQLVNETYRVSSQSNRMGVRFEGAALTPRNCKGMPSAPVTTGCLQVPPEGQPIALGADRQTLGGYPVMAVVASVDWPRLGQLRPGDSVRFTEIDLATAIRLRRLAERDLDRVAASLSLLGS